MEYSLGVGYLSTNYYRYEAGCLNLDNSGYLDRQEDGEFFWTVPTRDDVSFIWWSHTNLLKKEGVNNA